jgi:hypothetical protein
LAPATTTFSYTRGAAARALFPNAIAIDPDDSILSQGRLRVAITQGSHSGNRLSIEGGFVVSGDDILLNNRKVGFKNASGGVGKTSLEITLIVDDVPDLMQRLVRSISFRTLTTSITTQRKVEFTVFDQQGAASSPAVATINIT